MCFIYKSTINSISQNYQLYCQTLGQNNNNELVTENINTIDNRLNYILVQSNYINNIPIKILVYNYTIYILLEMVDLSNIKKVELYGCSLDLKLCIKYHNEITFDRHFTNVNILINSFHNLIFYERIIGSKTNIFYEDLSFNCTNFEKQFTSENKNNDMRLTDDIITESVRNKYLAFSLDSSTYLKIGDKRYFGSLEEATKLDGNKQIYLQYLSNSQITHNYYIIYNIDNTNEFNFYIHLSHFCYFKVINCQENCSLCHSEIVGNSESHQCKTCIPGYYKYNNGKNDKDYYNCYQEGDPNIPKNMYVNKSEEEFKYCNESCSECYYKDNCKSCNIGYYFKVDENSTNTIKDNRCFREAPDNYYLNITSNITFEEQIVRFVYKPCYNTCKTCLGDDNPINNNCLECRSDFIKYPFDDRKCTINKTNCSAYWKIENHTKKIECINNCSGYIIKNVSSNLNQQCVDNCNNFLNPYSEYYLLLSFECGGEKVCITFEECISRGLKYDNKNCYPDGNSCFYVPRTTIPVTTPIPPTEPPTEPPDIIENRVRFIKNFEIKKEYSEIKNNFEINQLQNYIKEFGREFNLGIYKNGLDFITFSKYKDFIITIYPLDTEDFVKEDLFNLKSLCYANFSKLFLNYKNEDENYKILIGLIEYENDNLPINTVNYFFMLFNEKERNGQIITNLTIDNNIIDISYPLYNYEHENISAKYSTELINTIKELNDIDENFNFFEKDNSFYNDICYTQTFDKDIDITIKDRIKEYYIEISFCEKGCTFKYIYDKDKNPKSFCECKLKKILDVADSNYSFNTTIKERESVSNFKALSCYGEVFSSELSSNPSFWIYLIVIFIHLALFISIIFCSKQAIQKMLKSKKENLINIENNNTYINNNDNKSVNIAFPNNNNNNNIKKEDKSGEDKLIINENKNTKESKISKVSSIIKDSNNIIEDNYSKDFKSSKKESSDSNPPKKHPINKSKETTSIVNSDKNKQKKYDNETSLFESEINYNFDKDSGFEDIFDDIGNTTSKMNYNNLNEKNIKKDNYIYLEKRQLFGKLKKSLAPLDKKVFNKYKYINTINEINDAKQARNIIITGFDSIKKEHYSLDDIKINPKNLNLINYGDIKNKGQKLSKFSKFFGEESILSGNEKFLQATNNIVNNKSGGQYEKDLKGNNNKNDKNSLLSNKKDYEQKNNLYKNKKKFFANSSNENSERNKFKNSLNSSINSNDKLISKRNIKNQKEEKDIKSQEEKEIISKKQNILSSTESELDDSMMVAEKQKNLCYFYCDYFIQREIFLVTFYHKKDNVSIFIRLPTFFVAISFIFTVICLFLTEKDIHNRYEYYNNHGGKINEIKYAFNNNLLKSFYIALINIVFKMLCVKLVYFVTFNVPDKIKEIMDSKEQKNMNQLELKEYNRKKKKYFKRYKRRSIIFMIIILILLLVFAYISICYCGVFKHSFIGILINFFISVIFSFIICAFLCFIVSIFYRCGCFSIFKVLKVIY